MDEPTWLLRAVTYHFGSGEALPVGLLLWLLAVQGNCWGWSRSRVVLSALLGCVWWSLASWPALVPQSVLIAGFIGWFIRAVCRTPTPRERGLWPLALGIAVLAALLGEYRATGAGALPRSTNVELAVIADSITAGLNDRDDTWPQQLSRRCDAIVWDASQQGATLKSARRQLAALGDSGNLLILEIGGNDLLEGLSMDQFAADLEQLLQDAAGTSRPIVMFELPLPPLCHRYGYHQRRLARKYGVWLIPKRELVGVLTTSGSTVDGIHLSDAGQARLAELVQRTLRLPDSIVAEARYHRVERR